MPYPNPDKYRFFRALRPFYLSVALISCGLGAGLALSQGQGNVLTAAVVVLTGLLLQAASHLASDYIDLEFWQHRSGLLAKEVAQHIKYNTWIAFLLLLIASLLGIWLTLHANWELLVIGTVGVLGGYGYTGKPFYFKRRGLGVFSAFSLAGVLMVVGSYYAMGSQWNSSVVLTALPISVLSAALLLANEIQAYIDDRENKMFTLTVRLGFVPSKVLYAMLLVSVYPLSFILYWKGLLTNSFMLIPSLLFVWQPVKLLSHQAGDIQLVKLTFLTGRFLLVFGVGFIAGIL